MKTPNKSGVFLLAAQIIIVQVCPDIYRGFAWLNDSCHKTEMTNGASQGTANRIAIADNINNETNFITIPANKQISMALQLLHHFLQ